MAAVHASAFCGGLAFEPRRDRAVAPAGAVSPGGTVIRFAVVARVLSLLLILSRAEMKLKQNCYPSECQMLVRVNWKRGAELTFLEYQPNFKSFVMNYQLS